MRKMATLYKLMTRGHPIVMCMCPAATKRQAVAAGHVLLRVAVSTGKAGVQKFSSIARATLLKEEVFLDLPTMFCHAESPDRDEGPQPLNRFWGCRGGAFERT
jgi:hypothetical protein